MNEFMKILLSLSVSGALLLILILGLKPLYKNRFSKRWQYYIWIVVALRFLLPFTPDTTIVGSLFEKFDTTAITNEIPTIPNVPVQVSPGNNEAEPIQTNRDMTAATTLEPFNKYVCLFFIWSALALVLFVRTNNTLLQSAVRQLSSPMGSLPPPCYPYRRKRGKSFTFTFSGITHNRKSRIYTGIASTAWHYIHSALQMLQKEMEGFSHGEY